MSPSSFIPTARAVEQATAAGYFPGRRSVEITDNQRLDEGVYRLTFRDPYIAAHAKAAQFVNLFSSDPLKLMPRPLGISEVNGEEVSLIFAVVGKGTDEFSHLRAGDTVDVLGPLGKPFRLQDDAHYVLVGGGLGAPPLIFTAQQLAQRPDCKVSAVFGYRSTRFADDLVGKYANRVESITNAEGNVVDLLNQIEDSINVDGLTTVILSCGPTPMMKAVASWAQRRGIGCQLSLEERMGCGYGTCVVCVVDTLEGRKKVCADGPVFTAEELGWA
ncbi:dihydroorotate dehydrogenase electron transfer subunit [Bifidobacterium tsurumiense]|uniref:Dihydroorotate dehydrogenase electron transfer subunit n=1 Tax=Bifidobacterium tsurumiense TaxID=356829 RepID=A0A087EEB8_9BIFI|nr:dihydroorotate dehydrogenase electron transfer subunit [Bifidobacterium tsurumiense]KFJ06119.1 dihydroorotate dehydrogenase electron transfer subunit [Bifidobacterium tsurumiense]MDY4678085.1 dihydroorotate dehydrogenase electron transfer subunit [Bifidobacterium tsurumiense]MSS12001.1 dihydroorotate dehydrogenase electron transfer subunit [Bifidobacterium tsurumiense]